MRAELERRLGVDTLDLRGAVLAISRIPYGRPRELTPAGVLADWRGTCSTKHLLLAAVVADGWPERRPALWHRPFRVTRALAADRWGADVAAVVPEDGLVDVHTFATVDLEGSRHVVDVTFPLADWDGATGVPLACGPGVDHAAGADPLASKAGLVARHCDPAVREPFVAALSGARVEPC